MASVSTGRGDELLPGIPDHLMMHHIAPKLKWETFKVLEMLNRGWQNAMRSRSVYDNRVLSDSTDPFLVLLSVDGVGKFVSTLYSCRDESVLHLPPIPTENRFVFRECVCLDGKIYLWVMIEDTSEGSAKVCVWVLDLAGDRKWWQGIPQSFPTVHFSIEDLSIGYGVLDGEIYKFRGSTHPDRGVLGGAVPFDRDDDQTPTIKNLMPEANLYDPVSDVWSRITPERTGDHSGSWSHDIAPILEWARDEFGADHSKAFSTDGWYEPYFSEWRRNYSSAPQSTIDVKSHNENQVYYRNTIFDWYEEYLFFFGGKLAKFTRDTMEIEDDREWNDAVSHIELFDTQKNKWKQWKSLKANFSPLGEEDFNFWIVDFASSRGVIWAIFAVNRDADGDDMLKYHLLRSPVLLDEDSNSSVSWIDTLLDENSDSSVSWIDTGHCLADDVARCIVRPIYL